MTTLYLTLPEVDAWLERANCSQDRGADSLSLLSLLILIYDSKAREKSDKFLYNESMHYFKKRKYVRRNQV